MMPSQKKKSLVGWLLLSAGLILLVIGLGYQAVNYPWGNLFGFGGADQMSDPDPLQIDYRFYHNSEAVSLNQGSLPASNSSLPLQRPNVDLALVGYIKIPRINISENIVEGTNDELLYGVGHLPGSAAPGDEGNCVLAGHRNYYLMHPFMHLNLLEIGDFIQLTSLENNQAYDYEVYKIFTVSTEETWVTQTQDGEAAMLTLITCTPVPTYSERLVIWARLKDTP